MQCSRGLLAAAMALAGAMAVLGAGCSREPDQAAVAPPASVGTQIDDTVVTSKVKAALFADPQVRSFDLKVETRKGEVQLSGFVDSRQQADRALAVTRGVLGVTRADDAITVKVGNASAGNTFDDGVITAKVKAALLADPGTKSFDIGVETRKGEVQMSGFVDSQAQIDHAVALALKVEGVASVNDEMSVKK